MTPSIAFSWIPILIIPVSSGSAPARDPVETSSWFSDARARVASDEFRFSPQVDAENAWSAPNRAGEFRTRVSAGGIHVEPRESSTSDDSWHLELSTRAFGRVDESVALDGAVLRPDGPRVELDHGQLVEWFVNDERGLEQGWTIARPPPGAGRVWIGLDVGGDLELRIDAGSRSGVFVDATGEPRLRYTGLTAFDATGCELDARLIPSPSGLAVVIDDTQALYPLTVDPVLSGPYWAAEGNQLHANFGRSVASAGDVNGDGYSDVIVGAYRYDDDWGDQGRAFVYHGSSAGLSIDADWTAEGIQPAAYFGYSVATAGDVNGDGYSDVIVGAVTHDRAFVYLGSSNGLAGSPAWTVHSDQANTMMGSSVSTAGDVNGDGYSDVIVGARLYDNGQGDEGRVFVYLGSRAGLSTAAAWTAESNEDGAQFGARVASAGDVNGDRYDDIIVGAFGYDAGGPIGEGRAFVYLGSATGLGTSAAWSAEGNQLDAAFGISVETAGDVNGDGFSDVIVGAHRFDNGQTDEGRAYVYLGSSSGLSPIAAWTAESDQADAIFGGSVSTAGDVNGDGYSDVIIGSQLYVDAPLVGRAFVYLGSSTGLATLPAWTAAAGAAGAATFAASLAAAGDVNGDGYSDVIVGAHEYNNGQAGEGRAFVYLGSSSLLRDTPSWTAISPQPGGPLSNLSSAGDVNGDGYSDVIVGARAYNSSKGRAFVYTGNGAGLSSSPVWFVEGDQVGAQLGISVANAGDVNGDGYGDVLVGASHQQGVPDEGLALVYHGSSTGLSTIAAWLGEGHNSNSEYGVSLATAGDVNGDGYSDVIVGASSGGPLGRGRVYLYFGSQSGLASAPASVLDGHLPSDAFGGALASAGDVNRDGYSDVIVGAAGHNNGQFTEGAAYVYLGSAAGLSMQPAWSAESNQASARYGISVASAGDVNGDGYSDFVVGASGFDDGEANEGAAFVYLGSSTGLGASASTTLESNNFHSEFGISLSSAGDVNGDGYSDVLIGASGYDNGQNDEGRGFVYLGSSTGLSESPAWTVESDEWSGSLGRQVAPAGDTNGDGYSDVLVNSFGGRVWLFLGNEGRGGWTLAPQQRQAHDIEPIQLLGRANDHDEFRIHLAFARTLTGFDWASGLEPFAKLEWQVEPLSSPLDGSDVGSGGGEVIDGSVLRFNELVSFSDADAQLTMSGHHSPVPSRPLHWRVRIRTNNPLFPVTPWVTISGNNVTEAKLRAGTVRAKR